MVVFKVDDVWGCNFVFPMNKYAICNWLHNLLLLCCKSIETLFPFIISGFLQRPVIELLDSARNSSGTLKVINSIRHRFDFWIRNRYSLFMSGNPFMTLNLKWRLLSSEKVHAKPQESHESRRTLCSWEYLCSYYVRSTRNIWRILDCQTQDRKLLQVMESDCAAKMFHQANF